MKERNKQEYTNTQTHKYRYLKSAKVALDDE